MFFNPDRRESPFRWPSALQPSAADLLCDIESLERRLHEPSVRQDRAQLQALLHPEFEEFGRSGQRWTREDVLRRLPAESDPGSAPAIEAREFMLRVLGPDCVQLTYRTFEEGRGFTRRCSLWERRQGRWQLRFHQGTPCSHVPSEPPPSPTGLPEQLTP